MHLITQHMLLFNFMQTLEMRVKVIRAAIQNILDNHSHKLNHASLAAEARRIAESLMKWELE